MEHSLNRVIGKIRFNIRVGVLVATAVAVALALALARVRATAYTAHGEKPKGDVNTAI